MGKTYVVFRGRVPRIYYTWDDCEQQVKRFKNNKHQAYESYEEAEKEWFNHLASMNQTPPICEVHNHYGLGAYAQHGGPIINAHIEVQGSSNSSSFPVPLQVKYRELTFISPFEMFFLMC